MVCVAWVFIQNAESCIPSKGAPHLFKDVLITIVIDVAKGDTVTFLEMAETARGSDILENRAVRVAEHAIGNESSEIWIASTQVKIEKAVIVQIAEVGTHCMEDFVQVGFLGHI